MMPRVTAKEFRPYRWRERDRHPVVSPDVAAMLAVLPGREAA
jgi:hypothetical protein